MDHQRNDFYTISETEIKNALIEILSKNNIVASEDDITFKSDELKDDGRTRNLSANISLSIKNRNRKIH